MQIKFMAKPENSKIERIFPPKIITAFTANSFFPISIFSLLLVRVKRFPSLSPNKTSSKNAEKNVKLKDNGKCCICCVCASFSSFAFYVFELILRHGMCVASKHSTVQYSTMRWKKLRTRTANIFLHSTRCERVHMRST